MTCGNHTGSKKSRHDHSSLTKGRRVIDMITYIDSAEDISEGQLQGFFSHWANRPSPKTLLDILKGSDSIVLAKDGRTGNVVGYITAISDGVSCAFIPHLEVHSDWRGQGIGSELVGCMLNNLSCFYAIDLMCDPELEAFYERFGWRRGGGMYIRNYERQKCE